MRPGKYFGNWSWVKLEIIGQEEYPENIYFELNPEYLNSNHEELSSMDRNKSPKN